MLDFTSNQFPGHEQDPFPFVRTRAQAEHECGWAAVVDMNSPEDRYFHNLEPLMPWDAVRERIPERGSEREREYRQ